MKKATRERIFSAGTVLSNIAHNLSQPSWPLDDHYRKHLKAMQREWDAAMSAYRSEVANSKQKRHPTPHTKGKK